MSVFQIYVEDNVLTAVELLIGSVVKISLEHLCESGR